MWNDVCILIKRRFTPEDASVVNQLIKVVVDASMKQLHVSGMEQLRVCAAERDRLYHHVKDEPRRIINATQLLQNQLDSERKNVQLLNERCLKGEQKISELTAELEQIKKQYEN